MTTYRFARVSALLALLSTAPAFGAAFQGLAYDGFDYTVGFSADATLNGGTGWNATGDSAQANTALWATGANLTASGTRTIATGSIEFSATGYAAPAGQSLQISGAGQLGRAFGQTVDSGTFYFSYLTQKTVDQVRTVNFSLFGTNERLAFGQIANNTNTRDPDGVWLSGAGANSGNFVALLSNVANSPIATVSDPASFNGVYVPSSPVAYALNVPQLIIGKIEFDYAGGPADRITYYVSPTTVTDEAALTPYLVIDHADIGQLTGFRMFAGGSQTASGVVFSPSAALFDEIRFGTTFASVTGAGSTPPPASPWQNWLNEHFSAGEQATPAIGGRDADPDGDGRSNLLEYALGSLPRAADTTPGPVARTQGGTLALDYPALREDVTYLVETSPDLATWTTTGVTDTLTGGTAPAQQRTATVARPESGRVFLRLRVNLTE